MIWLRFNDVQKAKRANSLTLEAERRNIGVLRVSEQRCRWASVGGAPERSNCISIRGDIWHSRFVLT